MVINITSIMQFIGIGSGIAFIILMNLQGHYIIKLNNLMKMNYNKLHRRLILYDTNVYGLFIPKPIRLFKYIWFEKIYKDDVFELIKHIRLYQIYGLIFLFLPVIILILYAIINEIIN